MKRHFLLLLGFVITFTSFVSCDDNDAPESSVCEVVVKSGGNGSVAITNNTGTTVNILKGNSLEVVATPDEGYEFVGWFVGNDDEPVSTDPVYTFVVKKNIVLVAKFRYPFVASGSKGGYEYVDLGLPSGLKWATCNVGAAEIYEKGAHYSWGETIDKTIFTWQYYQLGDGTDDVMTKYNTGDGKTVLDADDDVANYKWGGTWRMPTKEEVQELVDHCTLESVKVNGVLGLKVKGPNGKCIFLPAASYKGGSGNILLGWLRYWSSSLSDEYDSYACSLEVFVGAPGGTYTPEMKTAQRRLGYSVRPVTK